ELLENHGPSVSDQPPRLWRSQQDPLTEAAPQDATCLRLGANRGQPAAPNFSFEAKKSKSMLAQRTDPPVSSAMNDTLQRRYPSGLDDEEEQLPTMDQLLRQLGAAYQEGSIPELPKPVTRRTPHAGSVALSIADMARNGSAA